MFGISNRLTLSAFIGFVLVSGVFITFQVAKTNSMFCKYKDPYICGFFSHITGGSLKKLQGEYVESHQNIQVYHADWKLSGDEQEMLYKDDVSEQMHVIMVDEKVYLKDYTDGRWWEQSIETLEEYETKLPFEPSVFIGNLKSYFENEDNNIYFIQEDICGADSCRKYALSLRENDVKKVYFYISEKDSTLKKVQVQTDSLHQELSILNREPKIEKPEHDVKVAKAGENIFVENFLQRTQQSRKTPDYVKEFEQIRLQEEDIDLLGLPEYVNDEATDSAR
ncbi:hypothetical protein IPM65_03170 [Candidatus Roizmanbacteria bacterium]|nr:MAG: hypothetical protein IPM65_03170 [Candidatus Roizmanbacteria bacterium]